MGRRARRNGHRSPELAVTEEAARAVLRSHAATSGPDVVSIAACTEVELARTVLRLCARVRHLEDELALVEGSATRGRIRIHAPVRLPRLGPHGERG